MPYTLKNLPDAIKALPKQAQKIWMNAYNSAYKKYEDDEKRCNKIAWGAVKNAGYKKNKQGKWVKKEEKDLTALERFFEQLFVEAKALWKLSQSDEETKLLIRQALKGIFGDDVSVAALFKKVAIAHTWPDGKYYAVEYSKDKDGVSVGDHQEVEVAYIPKEIEASVERERDKKLKEEIDDTAVPKSIVESYKCKIQVLEEKDGKPKRLKGEFVEADTFNDSDPRRLYPNDVLEPAVKKFDEKPNKFGLDGHKDNGGYGDVVLIHDKLYMKDGIGNFESEIVTETEAGRVIQFIAEKGIPITVSLAGLGTEKYNEKMKDKKGNIGGFVVQKGYEIERLDPVLNQAFSNARAMLEAQQKENKEDNVDELKKMIEEINKRIVGLEKKVDEKGGFDEETKNLIATLKADKEAAEKKATNLQEAKDKVKEIMESDDYKGHEFKDTIKSQLDLCESKEDVERTLPRVLKILDEMKGKMTEPKPTGVVIVSEKGFFGDKKHPSTILEAYQWILDKFENKSDVSKMDNPRWVAKRLIDNYIKLHIANFNEDLLAVGVPDSEVLVESRRNPLYHLTKKALKEAVGDTEAYTGDITATTAYILPLYTYVMKDLMDVVNGVCSIQPLDRPTGKAFFMKEYYGDMAGGYQEISANFDKTKGQKGEGVAPQQLKATLDNDDITLKTPLKFQTPFTIELEQDLMAYFKMGIDSVNIQLMRKEVFREISHQILYHMLNTAALSKGDGLVQASGSPVEFSLTPDEGWTGGEWITKAFTRAIKQAGALLDVVPYEVTPDYIIAGSALSYLFTEPQFVADDSGKLPKGFGFRKVGTYQNEYAVYFTSMSDFNNKILLGYRGTLFTDAAEIFLPYILFYLGPRFYVTGLKANRECMSRFGIEKAAGKKLAQIDIKD